MRVCVRHKQAARNPQKSERQVGNRVFPKEPPVLPSFSPAILALADGTVFRGQSIGASGSTIGEVVFNTAITGYQEILTDPSYAGQIVTMTYPLIGNYGVDESRLESESVQAEAVVMRTARPAWAAWLRERGVVAIDDVDTRALVRRIRANGVLRCARRLCVYLWIDVMPLGGRLSTAALAGANFALASP